MELLSHILIGLARMELILGFLVPFLIITFSGFWCDQVPPENVIEALFHEDILALWLHPSETPTELLLQLEVSPPHAVLVPSQGGRLLHFPCSHLILELLSAFFLDLLKDLFLDSCFLLDLINELRNLAELLVEFLLLLNVIFDLSSPSFQFLFISLALAALLKPIHCRVHLLQLILITLLVTPLFHRLLLFLLLFEQIRLQGPKPLLYLV
mmetsp:Transcript_5523/g.5045  ORF Transcript_5523/g.5045 Transcript_5523/m.5045 type:complete len:211 (-) Transcript_5523:494-1126(-)